MTVMLLPRHYATRLMMLRPQKVVFPTHPKDDPFKWFQDLTTQANLRYYEMKIHVVSPDAWHLEFVGWLPTTDSMKLLFINLLDDAPKATYEVQGLEHETTKLHNEAKRLGIQISTRKHADLVEVTRLPDLVEFVDGFPLDDLIEVVHA